MGGTQVGWNEERKEAKWKSFYGGRSGHEIRTWMGNSQLGGRGRGGVDMGVRDGWEIP